MESVKIGLWSGINYPVEGHRVGLWKAAQKIFEQEGIKFSVFAGGLIDQKELAPKLRAKIQVARKDKIPADEVREQFYEEIADYLAKHFPALGVKTYIVTSPAYDGLIGYEVARRLAEKRRDIYHDSAKKRHEIKQADKKWLGVYTAEKVAWRADYFDAPVTRILKDEKKRSSQGLGDFNVVGPFGSSVYNPGDASDVKKPYASLPLLCKPGEVRTAENQFGIRILEVESCNMKESLLSTYSFKDLVSHEWKMASPPEDATEVQKAIVSAIGARGPMTIGRLEETTNKNRNLIAKEISALCEKKRTKDWPGMYFDEAKKEYSFGVAWFQKRLRYKLPKPNEITEESFLCFGCLHAACKWSDHKWFRDDVPKLCLKYDIKYLIGAGDFIEGLKHDLILKGEVMSGEDGPPNYTYQEKLAAYLVGNVIMKVFQERIKNLLQLRKGKRIEQEELRALVSEALLTFVFRSGNHCGWVAPAGFNPLDTFTSRLRYLIFHDVNDKLYEHGLSLPNHIVREILDKKVTNITGEESYELPSGLRLSIFHPEMSRTKTPSIRPQETLQYSEDQIVFSANFHTSESVEEWDPKLGQRVCLQVGTLKTKSGFEKGKLKIVDFGVGMLKVSSLPDKHIWKTQSAFFGEKKSDKILQADNREIIKDFDSHLKKIR